MSKSWEKGDPNSTFYVLLLNDTLCIVIQLDCG